VNTLLSGDAFDFHCHSNLTRAILPYGLAESDVHDVINLFQVTGLNRDGEYFMSVPYPNPSVSHVGKPSNDNDCGGGRNEGNPVPPKPAISSNSSPRSTSSALCRRVLGGICPRGDGVRGVVAIWWIVAGRWEWRCMK